MPMPLEGLRVIDWTIWQQGPVASAMLGDLGAEVIKIESKDGGDPGRGIVAIAGQRSQRSTSTSRRTTATSRASRSISSSPRRARSCYRLAAVSDVFVQNFRKGVADRLGLGADELRARNPRLIYANATGYGPEGPESGDPSFDHLGLARSGSCSRRASPTCRRRRSAAASPTRWARSCSPTACSPRWSRASATASARWSTRRTSAA
jgi:crotonobetainyl-CoA:carnitine CoA-transferase CaiB-like acyl-CoA transferase